MPRTREDEPTVDISAAEMKKFEKAASKQLEEIRPDLSPLTTEYKTLFRLILHMEILHAKIILGGMPASLVRQAMQDHATSAGTLLQAFGQKAKS